MSQGLRVNLGLMGGVVLFALLTSVSQLAALATAFGLVVCAGTVHRLENLPKVILFAIVALVPLSYLHTQVTFGSFNSLTKLLFVPAFAVLILDWFVARRPIILGRQGFFVAVFGLLLVISSLSNGGNPHSLYFITRFFSMFLLFFLCANVIRRKSDLAMLLTVIVVASLVSAMSSLVPGASISFGSGGSYARSIGWSFDDPPTFGTNVLMALLVSVYFLFVTRKMWLRVVLLPVTAILALAIVQTYARGIFVVGMVSIGFLLFRIRHRSSLPVALAVAGLLAVCLLPLIPHTYWDRVSSLFNHFGFDATINRRLASLRIGYQLFTQNPFLGFGPGNFMMHYMAPEFRFDHTGIPSVCFNLYLSIAAQSGLLGLAAFGLILWETFREMRFVTRSYGERDSFLKQAVEVLEVIIVAFLIVSLYEPTDLHKYMWIVFGAVAAAGHIRREQLAALAARPAETTDDPALS